MNKLKGLNVTLATPDLESQVSDLMKTGVCQTLTSGWNLETFPSKQPLLDFVFALFTTAV